MSKKAVMDQKVLDFLDGVHFAKLATLMKSGGPQVTPVWYMMDQGKLIVNTTTDRTKFRNVKRDPRVCLLIDNGYSYVAVFGDARVASERDPMKDIEALAIRYRGEEEGRRAARERYWKMDRISIEVVPRRVVSEF